ncbi:MAG: NAD(P)H-dependent oxidoreductase [Prevotella sp.]|nr:NAD(P)H-dependent oxidoreductase [Prevotella sp.]
MKNLRMMMAAVALLVSLAAGAKGRVLVVYFSHAGDNYAVGNIKVGNTKLVAQYIKEATGADEFEVVAVKSYDMAYEPLTRLAKQEQQRGEKPAFKGAVKNIGQYDTIFIGTPIWWGTFPQVMFTFFDKYNLNGKTLIPFATHEGSGMGRTVSDLQRLYPRAKVDKGIAIYGHDAKSSKARVLKWLKKFGF